MLRCLSRSGFAWALFLLLFFAGEQSLAQSPVAAPQAQDPVGQGKAIAVVVDGPSEIYQSATRQLSEEIRVLLKGRHGDWTVPSKPNFVGDFSAKGVRRQLIAALKDPQVGLVIAMGMDAARVVARFTRLPKPVLLPFAAPEFQGLPSDGKKSGRKNLAYLSGIVDIERELKAFVDITKNKDVYFLLDEHYFDKSGRIEKKLQKIVGEVAQIHMVPTGKSVTDTLGKIPAHGKAAYIGPLLRMPSSEYPALIQGLNQRKIASYASEGRPWVDMGALMSIVPDDDMQRRLRKLALYVDATIGGEEPSTFSTDYSSRSVLLLNLETARKVEVHPTFAQISDAEIVGEGVSARQGPSLSLEAAVNAALASNLDLHATQVDRQIATAQTREATAALYPTAQLQAGISQTLPESSAVMSFARTASWGGRVNIPIYSAMAWANRDSKLRAQDAADKGIRSKALDVIAETATAYVNVLRARNAKAINRQNLSRVRKNLEMAKVRVELGAAGRQEVFRWQIELAEAKANMIRAQAVCDQSDISLNRLMNRPLEAPLVIDAPGEEHLGMIVHPEVQPFVQDPFSFRVFREFMVRESIANSPEIQQLDNSVASLHQLRKGQKRDLWIPNLFASVQVNHSFYMDGAPAAFAAMVPPGAAGAGVEFPNSPVWTVGLNLAWTAFDFRRNARIEQSDQRIVQMQRQRSSLTQAIEQRLRVAMHQAGASGGVVELRERAAKAAKENFELVADAYAKGAVGIITLVDAQNQALQTELAAANALYDWLSDFVQVQRASGVFPFLRSKADDGQYIARLREFFRAHKSQSATH